MASSKIILLALLVVAVTAIPHKGSKKSHEDGTGNLLGKKIVHTQVQKKPCHKKTVKVNVGDTEVHKSIKRQRTPIIRRLHQRRRNTVFWRVALGINEKKCASGRKAFIQLAENMDKNKKFDANSAIYSLFSGLMAIVDITNSWVPKAGTYYRNMLLPFLRLSLCHEATSQRIGINRKQANLQLCNGNYGAEWDFRPYETNKYTAAEILKFYSANNIWTDYDNLWNTYTQGAGFKSETEKIVWEAMIKTSEIFKRGVDTWCKKDLETVLTEYLVILGGISSGFKDSKLGGELVVQFIGKFSVASKLLKLNLDNTAKKIKQRLSRCTRFNFNGAFNKDDGDDGNFLRRVHTSIKRKVGRGKRYQRRQSVFRLLGQRLNRERCGKARDYFIAISRNRRRIKNARDNQKLDASTDSLSKLISAIASTSDGWVAGCDGGQFHSECKETDIPKPKSSNASNSGDLIRNRKFHIIFMEYGRLQNTLNFARAAAQEQQNAQMMRNFRVFFRKRPNSLIGFFKVILCVPSSRQRVVPTLTQILKGSPKFCNGDYAVKECGWRRHNKEFGSRSEIVEFYGLRRIWEQLEQLFNTHTKRAGFKHGTEQLIAKCMKTITEVFKDEQWSKKHVEIVMTNVMTILGAFATANQDVDFGVRTINAYIKHFTYLINTLGITKEVQIYKTNARKTLESCSKHDLNGIWTSDNNDDDNDDSDESDEDDSGNGNTVKTITKYNKRRSQIRQFAKRLNQRKCSKAKKYLNAITQTTKEQNGVDTSVENLSNLISALADMCNSWIKGSGDLLRKQYIAIFRIILCHTPVASRLAPSLSQGNNPAICNKDYGVNKWNWKQYTEDYESITNIIKFYEINDVTSDFAKVLKSYNKGLRNDNEKRLWKLVTDRAGIFKKDADDWTKNDVEVAIKNLLNILASFTASSLNSKSGVLITVEYINFITEIVQRFDIKKELDTYTTVEVSKTLKDTTSYDFDDMWTRPSNDDDDSDEDADKNKNRKPRPNRGDSPEDDDDEDKQNPNSKDKNRRPRPNRDGSPDDDDDNSKDKNRRPRPNRDGSPDDDDDNSKDKNRRPRPNRDGSPDDDDDNSKDKNRKPRPNRDGNPDDDDDDDNPKDKNRKPRPNRDGNPNDDDNDNNPKDKNRKPRPNRDGNPDDDDDDDNPKDKTKKSKPNRDDNPDDDDSPDYDYSSEEDDSPEDRKNKPSSNDGDSPDNNDGDKQNPNGKDKNRRPRPNRDGSPDDDDNSKDKNRRPKPNRDGNPDDDDEDKTNPNGKDKNRRPKPNRDGNPDDDDGDKQNPNGKDKNRRPKPNRDGNPDDDDEDKTTPNGKDKNRRPKPNRDGNLDDNDNSKDKNRRPKPNRDGNPDDDDEDKTNPNGKDKNRRPRPNRDGSPDDDDDGKNKQGDKPDKKPCASEKLAERIKNRKYKSASKYLLDDVRTRKQKRTLDDSINSYLNVVTTARHILNSWIKGVGDLYSNMLVAWVRTSMCYKPIVNRLTSDRLKGLSPKVCSKDFGVKKWRLKEYTRNYDSSNDIIEFYSLKQIWTDLEKLRTTYRRDGFKSDTGQTVWGYIAKTAEVYKKDVSKWTKENTQVVTNLLGVLGGITTGILEDSDSGSSIIEEYINQLSEITRVLGISNDVQKSKTNINKQLKNCSPYDFVGDSGDDDGDDDDDNDDDQNNPGNKGTDDDSEPKNGGDKPKKPNNGGGKPKKPNNGGDKPKKPNNGGDKPNKPNNSGDEPDNSDGDPDNGGDKPSNGGDKPSNGGDKPSNGGDKPSNGGDKPSNGGDKPSNGGDKPNNGGDKPSNGGEKPSNGGEKPSNGGDKPSNGGDKPDQPKDDNKEKPSVFEDLSKAISKNNNCKDASSYFLVISKSRKTTRTFEDSFNSFAGVLSAVRVITNSWITTSGDLYRNLILTLVRTILCYKPATIRFVSSRLKGASPKFCTNDFGFKEWGWKKYTNTYGSSDEIINFYELLNSDFDALKKTYRADGFKSETEKRVWKAMSSSFATGFYRKDVSKWSKNDIVTIFRNLNIVLGGITAGFMDYDMATRLVNECNTQFSEIYRILDITNEIESSKSETYNAFKGCTSYYFGGDSGNGGGTRKISKSGTQSQSSNSGASAKSQSTEQRNSNGDYKKSSSNAQEQNAAYQKSATLKGEKSETRTDGSSDTSSIEKSKSKSGQRESGSSNQAREEKVGGKTVKMQSKEQHAAQAESAAEASKSAQEQRNADGSRTSSQSSSSSSSSNAGSSSSSSFSQSEDFDGF